MTRLLVLAIAMGLAEGAPPDSAVQQRVNEIHALIWQNYIQPENGLLLGRLDMAGRPFYLPGLRQSPSLEDTSLYGGMYLDAVLRRWTATRRSGAAARVRVLLQGLIKNTKVSPSTGLLARGIHPDGRTYFGVPSVDQYTGVMFAFWRYWNSGLATDAEKAEIRSAIVRMMERLERSNWKTLDEEGKPVLYGDLDALAPTRAERLLAFLAVTWQITGDRRWLDLYHRERVKRLEIATGPGRRESSWVQIQNVMAWLMLMGIVNDPADQALFRKGAMQSVETSLAYLDEYRQAMSGDRVMRRAEMEKVGIWSERGLARHIRTPFDTVSVVLMVGSEEHYERVMDVYRTLVMGLDFGEMRYVGYVFPGEHNYWLAVERGLLKFDPALDFEDLGAPYKSEAYRIMELEQYGPGGRSVISLH